MFVSKSTHNSQPGWFCLLSLVLACVACCAGDEGSPDQPLPWFKECHQTDQGLNCSDLNLDVLNGDIPEFVTSLDLRDNLLKEDEKFPFGKNLRILSLRNNKLSSVINLHLIERLPVLEDLDLSGNALTVFPQKLPAKLKKIDLGRNEIESTSEIILVNQIDELYLNENHISGDVGVCSDSHHENAECSAPDHLTKLDLSKNSITDVRSRGFAKLSRLKLLSLASNNIKSLKESTFHGLFDVEFLDISDNDLSSIHDKTFEGLKQLKFLYLRGNYLVTIPSKLPLLEWFDVSYNNIERVNETLKTSLYPIEMVNMGHNPFLCDCHILWLKEWYDRREYILDYSVDIPPDEYIPVCGSPEHLAGDHWDVLADQVFVCDQEEPKNLPMKIKTPADRQDQDRLESDAVSDTEKYVAAYDLHVQVRAVYPTMVKLEWRAPSHYTNLLIQYFKTEEEEETTLFAQIQATQGHHVLKHLDPDSSYKICVLPKAEALAPLTDINDCLTVHTPRGEGSQGSAYTGGRSWFQIDHTMESRFKMILGCFAVSVALVASGVILAEGIMRFCSEKNKEHVD